MYSDSIILLDTFVDVDPDGLTADLCLSEGSVFPYFVELKDTETGEYFHYKTFKTLELAIRYALKSTNKLNQEG